MKKLRYDLVFGLGQACSCSETLREAGLQLLSFPYDWVTNKCLDADRSAHDIRVRVREVCDGFSTWFGKNDFRFIHPLVDKRKDLFVSDRLDLVFNHDFPIGMPYDDAFELVRARYRRRADRLMQLIRAAGRVLVVRLDRPDQPVPTEVEDCRHVRRELARAFPNARFDLFLFSCEKGRAFENRIEETVEDGFTRVTFDYRNKEPDAQPFQVDVFTTGALLAGRFSVRDYRTRAEKLHYAKVRLDKRLARLKTSFRRLFGKLTDRT